MTVETQFAQFVLDVVSKVHNFACLMRLNLICFFFQETDDNSSLESIICFQEEEKENKVEGKEDEENEQKDLEGEKDPVAGPSRPAKVLKNKEKRKKYKLRKMLKRQEKEKLKKDKVEQEKKKNITEEELNTLAESLQDKCNSG